MRRMRFRILTMLLAVLAVGVLLGLTHNQIREYFFPKPAVMSEREFWKVVEDARNMALRMTNFTKGWLPNWENFRMSIFSGSPNDSVNECRMLTT